MADRYYDKKPVDCPICNKTFLGRRSLSNHKRFHNNKLKKAYSKRFKGKNNPRFNIHLKDSKSQNWKGDNVEYEGVHWWVRNNKPKPELCEEYKKVKPYDLANISGEYKRDINDFRWLCRSCHMKEDGRINNLKQFRSNI